MTEEVTVQHRILRRLEPLIDTAIEESLPEHKLLIEAAIAEGRHGLTYSTEPAREDQPGKWCCWITYEIVDVAGVPRRIATVAGTVVGVTVAGEFGALERWYLPDPIYDDDLADVALELDDLPRLS